MRQITAKKVLRDAKLDKDIIENILCSMFKINRVKLFLEKNNLVLSDQQSVKLAMIAKQIREGLPPQYATGNCEFYSRYFKVNRDVLIPRPESELLVANSLNYLQKNSHRKIKIIDVGCGSGCLVISLIKELVEKSYLQNFKFYAVEISPAALSVAKANAQKHQVKQIKFYRSDLFSNLKLPSKFDLIIANLPYLPANYLKTFPKSIVKNLKYEPKIALNGGRDGLRLIEKLIYLLAQKLNKGGLALIEFDPSQTNKIKKILKKSGLKYKIDKDLNGRNRLFAIEAIR